MAARMQRCAAQVLPTTRHLMTRAIATRAVAPRAVPAALRPAFGALLPSQARRALSSSAPHPEMEDLNTEFAEARYALADAEESVGTTYFSDDLEDARDATDKVRRSRTRPHHTISPPRSPHLHDLISTISSSRCPHHLADLVTLLSSRPAARRSSSVTRA